MQIIEYNLVGKTRNQAECEDGIFIGEAYIAVIDGATSRKPLPWAKERAGRIAMTAIINALQNAKKAFSACEMVQYLENALRQAYGSHFLEATKDIELQMFANAIIYSDFRKEIWRFGDCNCLINKKLIQYQKEIDERIAAERSKFIASEIKKGRTIDQFLQNDISAMHIEPLLADALKLANSKEPLGYVVLNGVNADAELVDVFSVNAGDEIVLASDGYPVLKDTLLASENELANVIRNDPLMYQTHKCVKGVKRGNVSFDDRAYIRFVV